jgi:putative effector of murein hydrolase
MQGAGPLGAGDFLMSFLGVVILSFGFKIYGQRRLMVRHAPEIFGSTILSAAFSMFSTVSVARAINLAPGVNCFAMFPLFQYGEERGVRGGPGRL